VKGITRGFIPGVPIYLAATLLALVNAAVSLALFGALALFYVFMGSVLVRDESPV
jgi:hypothetical protein